MTFVNLVDLIARDIWVKNGPDLNEESLNLTNIYLGRARELTRSWLRRLGQGDPDNIKPLQTKLLKRFVQTAAVCWAAPPTRRLNLAGAPLPDQHPEVVLTSKIYQRSKINSYMKSLDRWRTIHGQSILYLSPPNPAKPHRLGARIFWPHSVMRDPDDTAQDDIQQDRRVAFEVMHDPRQLQHSIWHYYEQVEPGQWHAFRVYRDGSLVTDEDAIYPGGVVPFKGAPFICVYDELPEGRAWLPIDATRSAFALGQNVAVNDIAWLLKQEGHSVVAVTGADSAVLPKRWGPGEVWGFEDPAARVNVLSLNPKLAESIKVSEHMMSVFAVGEGLPADYFLSSRKFETGAAGRLRQADLDARRQDQVQEAIETELALFDVVREIWNATGAEGYADIINEDVAATVELGRPWFPTDLGELQQTYAFDLSIGACSMIDYLMERYRFTREQAIDYYDRVQVDRETYAVRENPAALIVGRYKAGSAGSATKQDQQELDEVSGEGLDLSGQPLPGQQAVKPDASSMNPKRSASNEMGSVVGAARKGVYLEATSADD